jgi:hypothetical protein
VHPIVAAAWQRRASGSLGAPGHGSGRSGALASGEGDLGWPGPARDGTGQGWPVDARTGLPVSAPRSPLTVLPERPATRRLSRRGWSGGLAPAVEEDPRADSAA